MKSCQWWCRRLSTKPPLVIHILLVRRRRNPPGEVARRKTCEGVLLYTSSRWFFSCASVSVPWKVKSSSGQLHRSLNQIIGKAEPLRPECQGQEQGPQTKGACQVQTWNRHCRCSNRSTRYEGKYWTATWRGGPCLDFRYRFVRGGRVKYFVRVATFEGLGHSQGEILKNNDHSRKLLFVQWYYSSRVHVQLQRSRHFGWKKVPVWNRCFNLSAFVKWSKQGYANGGI